MTYDAIDTDDDRVIEADVDNSLVDTKRVNTSIHYLRQYADNPDAAGTEADPLNNALANILSQEGLPLTVEMGGDYYKESSLNTLSSPGLQIIGGYGDRPDLADRMGVLAVGSGTSLLKVDGSGANDGRKLSLENLWLRQEANDQTGTGLELLDGSDYHLERVGTHGFDTGFLYDGAVGLWGYNVRSKDCNIALQTAETNNTPTTLYQYGGYLGNTQGTSAAVVLPTGHLRVDGVTFQNCDREAIITTGAQRLTLNDCWFENNALDNAGTFNINISTVESVESRISVSNSNFVSTGNVTDDVRVDADCEVVISNLNQRSATTTNLTTTANATGHVYIIGRIKNTSINAATDIVWLDVNGTLRVSPDGARIQYDSTDGEVETVDDAGNVSALGGGRLTEDGNSPLTGSGASSYTYTLSGTYDMVIATNTAVPTQEAGTLDLRVNGQSGSTYDYVDTGGTQTTGDTQFSEVAGFPPPTGVQMYITGRWGNHAGVYTFSSDRVSMERGSETNSASPLDSFTVLNSGGNNWDAQLHVYGFDR